MRINWRRISIQELAAVVTQKLAEKGIDSLIVGGACVSMYTDNRYLSGDIDLVSHAALKQIAPALAELGFVRQQTRHFIRPGCPFFIEIVSPPAAIGREPVQRRKTLSTSFGSVALLTPTDCVKDRLAAFFHWNDPQALEQALMVAQAQPVNLREIKRWSEHEGYADKYMLFRDHIEKKDAVKPVKRNTVRAGKRRQQARPAR